MAYGVPEFPGTRYNENDFGRMIAWYKKLCEQYKLLVDEVAALDSKIELYNTQMKSWLRQELDSQLKQKLTQVWMELNQIWQYMGRLETNWNNQWTALSQKQQQMVTEMLNMRQEMDAMWDAYDVKVKNVLTVVNTLREADRLEYLGLLHVATNNWEKSLEELKDYVESLPTKSELVVNPVTGKISTSAEAIMWVYRKGCGVGGFSAGEWDGATWITCEYFDKSGITCNQFFVDGKRRLNWYKREHMMISPITGKYVTIEQAVVDIYRHFNINALTAEEYDRRELTAEEYDEKQLTAGNYDYRLKGDKVYVYGEDTSLGPATVAVE